MNSKLNIRFFYLVIAFFLGILAVELYDFYLHEWALDIINRTHNLAYSSNRLADYPPHKAFVYTLLYPMTYLGSYSAKIAYFVILHYLIMLFFFSILIKEIIPLKHRSILLPLIMIAQIPLLRIFIIYEDNLMYTPFLFYYLTCLFKHNFNIPKDNLKLPAISLGIAVSINLLCIVFMLPLLLTIIRKPKVQIKKVLHFSAIMGAVVFFAWIISFVVLHPQFSFNRFPPYFYIKEFILKAVFVGQNNKANVPRFTLEHWNGISNTLRLTLGFNQTMAYFAFSCLTLIPITLYLRGKDIFTKFISITTLSVLVFYTLYFELEAPERFDFFFIQFPAF